MFPITHNCWSVYYGQISVLTHRCEACASCLRTHSWDYGLRVGKESSESETFTTLANSGFQNHFRNFYPKADWLKIYFFSTLSVKVSYLIKKKKKIIVANDKRTRSFTEESWIISPTTTIKNSGVSRHLDLSGFVCILSVQYFACPTFDSVHSPPSTTKQQKCHYNN